MDGDEIFTDFYSQLNDIIANSKEIQDAYKRPFEI